jgi:hypothetical protein
MATANLTKIKDRIAELNVVPIPKDKTGAARSRRYRQRRKSQRADRTVAQSATPEVITASQRRHGIVPFVLLAAALAVAAVSGAFSIVGMTAIFAGAFWAVIGMGVALESAKLSAVAWLGRDYRASHALKGAIVMLVVALMALNVIGAYGFLAKAHIAHEVVGEAQVADHQAQIEARKEVAAANVADLDRRIGQIDSAIAEATRRGRTTAAMVLAERQTARRNELVADRARAAGALASIEVEKAGIENELNGLAAESVPVRYLSKLVGIDQDTVTRWFVLFVALLLDPLALVLLLAATARPNEKSAMDAVA